MGAYGAILYAKRLNLESVLALSPQYTIAESFDKRWNKYSQKISWQYTMEMAIDYSGELHLIYDPLDLDAKHAHLIKNKFHNSRTTSYEIKYSSHPVTHYLNDGGVLKELLLSFVNNNIKIPIVERKKNKTYLRTLSIALTKKNKLNLAKAIIIKAIELGDERHSTYRQASNICHHLKDFESAILYARQAIEAAGNNNYLKAIQQEHLANMLRLTGQFDDALKIIDEALLNDVNRFSAYATKANILLNMKNICCAKDAIIKAIELGDERHSTYRQASNIYHRLKDFESALAYANQAVEAKDNNDASRTSHKEHLVNILRSLRKGDFLKSAHIKLVTQK